MLKQRVYKNLLMVGIIILSYIALLFLLTNEGLKSSSTMVKSNDADLSTTIPMQEANFNEIRINKNLLDVE